MKRNMLPAIGLTAGMALVIWSITMSGEIINFVDIPSVIITILGSFCALMISFPFKTLRNLPVTLKILLFKPKDTKENLVTLFSDLAKKARKNGLLSLEDDIVIIEDKFLASGLQMVIDGMEADIIRKVLELKLDTTYRRHRIGQDVFKKWGELAPAFGMLGTLIGLIIMLSRLDDPSSIGSGMATALVTTFYGSLMANLVFLPIANNLEFQTDEEISVGEMILDGILEIQAGTNPRILEEKLMTYLSSEEKNSLDTKHVFIKEADGYEQ